jgi:hypothetical protein
MTRRLSSLGITSVPRFEDRTGRGGRGRGQTSTTRAGSKAWPRPSHGRGTATTRVFQIGKSTKGGSRRRQGRNHGPRGPARPGRPWRPQSRWRRKPPAKDRPRMPWPGTVPDIPSNEPTSPEAGRMGSPPGDALGSVARFRARRRADPIPFPEGPCDRGQFREAARQARAACATTAPDRSRDPRRCSLPNSGAALVSPSRMATRTASSRRSRLARAWDVSASRGGTRRRMSAMIA